MGGRLARGSRRKGFGARLLALQDADGQWAGGAFFPADFDFEGQEMALRRATVDRDDVDIERAAGMGVGRRGPPRAPYGRASRRNARWEYDDLPYWGGEVDCCINAWTLANGVWLGADVAGSRVVRRSPDDDGGWNCEWVEGSTRSSFHSTLNLLKGLLDVEEATGGSAGTAAARSAGRGVPPRRRLIRRLSTSQKVHRGGTASVPIRWVFSVLKAADYFRAAAVLDGGMPDPRLAKAIELVRAARQPDGTWLQATGIPVAGGSRSTAAGCAVEVADRLRHPRARGGGTPPTRLCRWR